ncbi:MAG: diguanylate cyclase [Candidatus Lambdaproteobacteria bacterium]|nr:diguanylate cyclase [Candidatus Lambdaproteobacteria bacterium]
MQAVSAAARQGRPQVMVVDDDPRDTQALSEQLSGRYEVRTYADAPAALDALRDDPPDLLICEQRIAERSGSTFLQDVKRLGGGTKIIVLTAFVNLDTVLSTIQSVYIDYFLAKPFERGQLNHVVNTAWADRQRDRDREALLSANRHTIQELERLKGNLEASVVAHAEALIQLNAELERALLAIQDKNRELTKLNESLTVQATIDPLTGLHNRREFDRRLAEEWARFKRYSRPLSLIMLDIDHFKQVNDTYGHECGDRVLFTLAGLMRSSVRIQDTVCRFGGEEFIVLLPETPLPAAFQVAENLRHRVAEHAFFCQDIALRIQVSLGVAGATDSTPLASDELLKMTDQSMYRAKQDGRNRTVALDPNHPERVLLSSAPQLTA